MVLAFRPGVPGSNPVQIIYFCMHLFISFFVMDFVRKTMFSGKDKPVTSVLSFSHNVFKNLLSHGHYNLDCEVKDKLPSSP